MGAACGVSGTGEVLGEGGDMMATVQHWGSPGWVEQTTGREEDQIKKRNG